jgi:hypothetical protein
MQYNDIPPDKYASLIAKNDYKAVIKIAEKERANAIPNK